MIFEWPKYNDKKKKKKSYFKMLENKTIQNKTRISKLEDK